MKIAFAGTPDFARAALDALIHAGHDVGLVLTQPDRPSGRGLKTQPSPVKDCALQHGLPLIQPRSLKQDGRFPEDARDAHERLARLAPNVMVVAAYGLILPGSILSIPAGGCLNIHASLLPRWRGAAPIERAIEAGDRETGITIMQMDEGLDTGAILAVAHEPIGDDDNAGRLRERLAAVGAREIVAALVALNAQTLSARAQAATGATYAAKLNREEGRLQFDAPAERLAARIRAFDPHPGAYAHYGSDVIKLWSARAAIGQEYPPAAAGTIVAVDATRVSIACSIGVLAVEELQRPGGRRLAAREFLQGFPLEIGRIFN